MGLHHDGRHSSIALRYLMRNEGDDEYRYCPVDRDRHHQPGPEEPEAENQSRDRQRQHRYVFNAGPCINSGSIHGIGEAEAERHAERC